MSEITKEEFCRRFVEYMVAHAGFGTFDDGHSVKSYAEEMAPTYWVDEHCRPDGPEVCAAGDMDYWGEE